MSYISTAPYCCHRSLGSLPGKYFSLHTFWQDFLFLVRHFLYDDGNGMSDVLLKFFYIPLCWYLPFNMWNIVHVFVSFLRTMASAVGWNQEHLNKILQKQLIFIWGNQYNFTDDSCSLITFEQEMESDWFILYKRVCRLMQPGYCKFFNL